MKERKEAKRGKIHFGVVSVVTLRVVEMEDKNRKVISIRMSNKVVFCVKDVVGKNIF